MGRKYKTVEEQGLRFVFAYDDDAPDLLHIYVRYLTVVDDPLDTFFNGQTHWNEGHKRFETYTDACGLFWFWLERDKAVMVISCFKQ